MKARIGPIVKQILFLSFVYLSQDRVYLQHPAKELFSSRRRRLVLAQLSHWSLVTLAFKGIQLLSTYLNTASKWNVDLIYGLTVSCGKQSFVILVPQYEGRHRWCSRRKRWQRRYTWRWSWKWIQRYTWRCSWDWVQRYIWHCSWRWGQR